MAETWRPNDGWGLNPERVAVGRKAAVSDPCPGVGKPADKLRCPACQQAVSLHPSGITRLHSRPAWMVERDAKAAQP